MWLPAESDERRGTLGVYASWLGLPLGREPACTYEPNLSPSQPGQLVMQMRFGEQPATEIREGSRGTISIEGRSYDALVSKQRKATIVWITPKR